MRRHLRAVYAFARLVDDVGDEADETPSGRLRLLDAVEADLDRAYAGRARMPVMRELAVTADRCGIPAEPFRRLIAANRQDQLVRRYETIDELLGYCELSANPVGHVVLSVFGAFTRERARLSDRICTALQLIEHWQDVAEDLARDRVYLPAEDLARFGVAETDLAARRAGPRMRALMAFETDRATRMLDEGVPLVHAFAGFPRLATAGYVAGGRAAAATIAARGHDVLASSPRPRRARVAREWLCLLGGRAAGLLEGGSGGATTGRG